MAKEILSTQDCDTDAPEQLFDPVCYDGLWVESFQVNSPNFWDCGIAPLDLESPICNHETGQWEAQTPTLADDQAFCGELPVTEDFIVCDYTTLQWVAFQAPDVSDHLTCGNKPSDVGLTMCNHETG